MKYIFLLFISLTSISKVFSNCTADYTININGQTVSFQNTSSLQNAHYYWNFGDGTTSYEVSPVHQYEPGHYLVTLYARDTISACVDTKDLWIYISSSDTCSPVGTDTIEYYTNQYHFIITDSNKECSGYQAIYDAATSFNIPPGWDIVVDNDYGRALYLTRIRYINTDSSVTKMYFITCPFRYTSAINYSSKSANFEYQIIYGDTGINVNYTAMNDSAIDYEWYVSPSGTPISTGKTYSYIYPYYPPSGDKYVLNEAELITTNTNNIKDTVTQVMVLLSSHNELSVNNINEQNNISVYPNPATDKAVINLPNGNIDENRIRLYDVSGRLAKEEIVKTQNAEIDIKDLPKGFYIGMTENKNYTATFKLLKQ